MSDLHAFELLPEYPLEDLNGATTVFGADCQTLDIKKALESGDGTIVTGSPLVINSLRSSEILKEVTAADNAQPTELDVELPQEAGAVPAQYTPQVSPSALEAADTPAVHAPEPETVEQAAAQPDSQVVGQAPTGDGEQSPPQNPPPEEKPRRLSTR